MSCSYCYNEGHNRRTCTVLTERLERDQASGSGYAKDALAARGKGSGTGEQALIGGTVGALFAAPVAMTGARVCHWESIRPV